MTMTKEAKEQVDALTKRYQERLLKRVEEGKDLPGDGTRRGRMPTGLKEENYDVYAALRGQLREMNNLRRQSLLKLQDIKEQMAALCGKTKKVKKVAKKKKATK